MLHLASLLIKLNMRSFSDPVIIPPNVIEEGSKPWMWALVVKFLGPSVRIDRVPRNLAPIWNTQHEWEIFPMGNNFFIFGFTSGDDRDRVFL